jgi:hypothetical protein
MTDNTLYRLDPLTQGLSAGIYPRDNVTMQDARKIADACNGSITYTSYRLPYIVDCYDMQLAYLYPYDYLTALRLSYKTRTVIDTYYQMTPTILGSRLRIRHYDRIALRDIRAIADACNGSLIYDHHLGISEIVDRNGDYLAYLYMLADAPNLATIAATDDA